MTYNDSVSGDGPRCIQFPLVMRLRPWWSPREQDLSKFISITQLAAEAGLSVSTVRRYLRDDKLPRVQPGGARCRVLVPANALDGLAAGHSQRPEPSQKRGPSPKCSKRTPPFT